MFESTNPGSEVCGSCKYLWLVCFWRGLPFPKELRTCCCDPFWKQKFWRAAPDPYTPLKSFANGRFLQPLFNSSRDPLAIARVQFVFFADFGAHFCSCLSSSKPRLRCSRRALSERRPPPRSFHLLTESATLCRICEYSVPQRSAALDCTQ